MERINKKELGKLGEEKASQLLISKGYKIIIRNYRFSKNEIDIIAFKDQTYVFVEVKTLRTNKFGEPQELVTNRKQRAIINTAMAYISENNINNIDCRFDVIAIKIANNKTTIEHIENAFQVSQDSKW
jgi:putative endonuclease